MMDINNECLKASDIMSKYRMTREDQIAVVKILMAAGVEHCLNEQQALRDGQNAMINRAQGILVH
jgi:hypothetical protein